MRIEIASYHIFITYPCTFCIEVTSSCKDNPQISASWADYMHHRGDRIISTFLVPVMSCTRAGWFSKLCVRTPVLASYL